MGFNRLSMEQGMFVLLHELCSQIKRVQYQCFTGVMAKCYKSELGGIALQVFDIEMNQYQYKSSQFQ